MNEEENKIEQNLISENNNIDLLTENIIENNSAMQEDYTNNTDVTEEPVIKKNNTPLVIILVVAVFVMVAATVAMFVNSWVKDKINPEEYTESNNTQKPNENVNVYKEPEIDPYANYKNLTWSSYISNQAKIEDNAVYYGGVKLDLGITGTYKSIEVIAGPYSAKVYLLTEAGNVWSFDVNTLMPSDEEGYVDNITRHLYDIKILEMVYRDTNTLESVYFLTEKGELIDINKIPYDKYDFVGIISDYSMAAKLPYDANNYLYHWNEKTKEYEQIINKSKQKITASKVIELGTGDGILIVTEHGNMYKYDTKSNIAVQVGKNVKSVEFYEFKTTKDINMIITYKEGPKETQYNVAYVYDMKSGEFIDLMSLKTFDAYAKHSSISWVDSNEKIGEGETLRKIYCENDDSAYLVIGEDSKSAKQLTLIEGTPIKAHIYRTMNALTDSEITMAYVLTEDGKVYEVNSENGITSEVTALSKYNIIDMTCIGEEYKMMYFLTDAGELLTNNGNIYSE